MNLGLGLLIFATGTILGSIVGVLAVSIVRMNPTANQEDLANQSEDACDDHGLEEKEAGASAKIHRLGRPDWRPAAQRTIDGA